MGTIPNEIPTQPAFFFTEFLSAKVKPVSTAICFHVSENMVNYHKMIHPPSL